jgi:hypothetical protein
MNSSTTMRRQFAVALESAACRGRAVARRPWHLPAGHDKPAARQQLILERPRPPLAPAGLHFSAVAHAGMSSCSASIDSTWRSRGHRPWPSYSPVPGCWRSPVGRSTRCGSSTRCVQWPTTPRGRRLRRCLDLFCSVRRSDRQLMIDWRSHDLAQGCESLQIKWDNFP